MHTNRMGSISTREACSKYRYKTGMGLERAVVCCTCCSSNTMLSGCADSRQHLRTIGKQALTTAPHQRDICNHRAANKGRQQVIQWKRRERRRSTPQHALTQPQCRLESDNLSPRHAVQTGLSRATVGQHTTQLSTPPHAPTTTALQPLRHRHRGETLRSNIHIHTHYHITHKPWEHLSAAHYNQQSFTQHTHDHVHPGTAGATPCRVIGVALRP